MKTDDSELMQLIYQQCQSIQTTIVNRLASGRPLTQVALGDLRRELSHLTRKVEDEIVERGGAVAG